MSIISRIFNDPLWPLVGFWKKISILIKNDKFYLKVLYFLYMKGQVLNLNNPRLFSEKLQWLKIYDRKPEYTEMVDKAAVKEYIRSIIGDEYIIPTIGVWDKVEDIDWDSLPKQFVLKTTHGGGGYGVVICTDKDSFNKKQAIDKLNKSLRTDIFISFREWPYKDVPRRIIAEKYLSPASDFRVLSDYKFYCFGGEPKYCQVIRDRNTKESIDFYDLNWNHQEFVGLNPKCENGITPVEKPKCLSKMIEICRALAKNIPFIRVDLYVVEERVYFGELTFYPASGFGVFRPKHWDYKLSEMIKLPN